METNVTKSSIRAYYEVKDMRQTLENQVFKLLLGYSEEGLNIRQIGEMLKIDKSNASARLNSLKNTETIKYNGKKYQLYLKKEAKDTTTNKTVQFWAVNALA